MPLLVSILGPGRVFSPAFYGGLATAIVVLALIPQGPASAQHLPTGGAVTTGAATIVQPNGTTLNINQSTNQAIINWNTFSVGQGNTVNFNQPSAASSTLNRVLGSTPSWIAGTINAPGTVLLINPNGIEITKSGVVNTGSFAASTLNITDSDYLSGRYKFNGNGASAGVINNGRINVSDGGFAALLGGQVSNNGIISARLGFVALGAGEEATLDLSGDGFLSVGVPSSELGKLVNANGALVSNRGKIIASGGTVFLSAATAANILRNAVNIPGSIRTNSVGTHNGRIVINGGGGRVSITGKLAANGGKNHSGGSIAVTGENIADAGNISANGSNGGTISLTASNELALTGTLMAQGYGGHGGAVALTATDVTLTGATVNASGATAGGLVLIGGDFQGGNGDPSSALYQEFLGGFTIVPDLTPAQTVSIDTASTINVSATNSGNAGTAVVWSQQQTNFAGSIIGTGGPNGGNGGYAEVSSHNILNFIGKIDLLGASGGNTGTLLLDPANVTISTSATSGDTLSGGTTYSPTSGAATSNILNTDLEAALTSSNVTVTTTNSGTSGGSAGTITVSAPVTWSSGYSFTLTAASSIAVNASLTSTATTGTGSIILTAGAGAGITIGSSVTVSTASQNASITLTGDTLTLASMAAVQATGGTVTIQPATPATAINVGGTVDPGSDLFLSTANLNGITAATLVLGNASDSGPLTVSGVLSGASGGALQNVGNLTLVAGSGGISIANPITIPTSGTLTLNSSGAVTQGPTAVISGTGELADAGTGTVTLSAVNTYTGTTAIDGLATLALLNGGSIATSSGVVANGTFDISGNGGNTTIGSLTGSGGQVNLGVNTLIVTATGSFTGTLGASGDSGGFTVNSGTQTLSGVTGNYEGATTIASSAGLLLTSGTNISTSSGVVANGTFDISGNGGNTTIGSLTGSGGQVNLGVNTLIVTATGSFTGTLGASGDGGGFTVNSGTQTLSGVTGNYEGATTIASSAGLLLTSGTNISTSSGVVANGTFDISGNGGNTTIGSLTGSGGQVNLGVNTLIVTATGSFTGTLGASGDGGGFTVNSGTQTLSGVTGNYEGATTIASSAGLLLTSGTNISTSSGVVANGTFDISGNGGNTTIGSLTGSGGQVNLGVNTLTLSSANGTFAGAIGGTGGLTVNGTGNFTANNMSNSFGGILTLNTTGNVSIVNSALTLGTSSVGGTLTLTTTTGNLTQNGPLTVGSASSFTTSASNATITLNNANLLTGAVSLNTSGTSGNAALTNDLAGGLVLGASNVGGNLTVVSTLGSLTQLGSTALTVGGTSSFTTSASNATITLNNANLLTGAVSLNTSGTSGNAALTNDLAGGLVLGASNVGGNLTVVSTLGSLTQLGSTALTVGGTSSFTTSAPNQTIALTNAANLLTRAVTLNTSGANGSASLTDSVALNTIGGSVGGLATLNAPSITFATFSAGSLAATATTGGISQTGVVTVTGTSSFTDSTTDQTITLTSANLLTGAVTLNTSGTSGNASLTNGQALALAASSVGGNLTLTADMMTFTGTVTASGHTVTLQPYTASTAINVGGTPSSGLALSTANLNQITALTLQVGNSSDTGLLTVSGALSAASNGALQNVSNLTLAGGAAAIDINNAIKLASTGVLTLNTTGKVTQTAPITVSGLLLLGSGGSYMLTNGGNFIGTLAADPGTISVNDDGNLTIGSVAGTAGVTASGPITLTAGGNLTIDSGDSVNSTGSNVVLAATDFINNGGSGAVTAPAGRWAIYSNNPTNDTFDGLSSNGYIWGTSYPGSIPPSGDYYVFAVQAAGYVVPPTSSGGSAGGTTITFQAATAQVAPLSSGLLTTGALGDRVFDIPAPTETHFIQNEVVVQVNCDTPQQAIDAVAHDMHLSIIASKCMDQSQKMLLRLRINSGHSVADVIRALERFQIIAVAQPNYGYQAQPDAQRVDQAVQTEANIAIQYALAKLDLTAIHKIATGIGVKVAVIDSQIDVKNPELAGNIAGEFDAVGAPEPPDVHGTEMAGVIAAHDRLTGVAPGAEIYAIHAFSRAGDTFGSSTFDIVNALNWAIGQGVRVINMSFTGPRDPSIDRALKIAHDKGIVLVAAAGNFGPDSPPLYPGADPNVIAVTATDSNDMVFSGANRGNYISVAAPGVDIAVPAPEATYQLTTGTSVAAAEVSGVAALLLQRNPALTPDDVRSILTSTAKHPGDQEHDDTYGWGLIDLAKAIQAATETKPAPTQ